MKKHAMLILSLLAPIASAVIVYLKEVFDFYPSIVVSYVRFMDNVLIWIIVFLAARLLFLFFRRKKELGNNKPLKLTLMLLVSLILTFFLLGFITTCFDCEILGPTDSTNLVPDVS